MGAESQEVEEIRADLKDLRRRLIYHRKLGRRAPRLRKAYNRMKSRLAVTRRAWRNQQLSTYFHIDEFHCHDGTRVPKSAVPSLRMLCKHVLDPMREEFGPCKVTSGYRTKSYNQSIGGATQSRHIYDQRPKEVAADVTFARGNPTQWARKAKSQGAGGVGTYMRSHFVHIDLGPRREWNG